MRRALGLLLLGCAAAAQAQAYRWTDEQGRVRYSDTPPADAREHKQLGATPKERSRVAMKALASAAEKFPLTLYSSPTCIEGCVAARAALNRRGAPFREVQIWNEETNRELMSISGGNEVPVLLVGEHLAVKGFEQEQFDRALDAAGYPKQGDVPQGEQAAPAPPAGYIPPEERAGARAVIPE